MPAGHASELVRSYFLAFQSADRAKVDALFADDFTFTSPNNDDHISKAAYFEKCWPGSANVREFHILNLVDSGDEALIRYECALKDGKRFRNMEYFRTAGDQIHEIDVYFGRDV